MIPDEIKLKDIKPALSGYIAESLRLLKSDNFPDEDSVHDIRVLMKKSRAVMKLISSQVDEEFFRKEHNTFRDAGRMLAAWRETSVHRKTLKTVRKSHRELIENLELKNQLIASLMMKPGLPEKSDNETIKTVSELESMLKKSLYRIRFYKLDNPEFRGLFRELNNTYNTVSHIYLDCRNKPKPGRLHTFRKRVKDFLYQLYFFRPLNPPVIKKLEKNLDNLAQNLGKYNDISQLIVTLDYKYDDPANTPEFDELVAILKGIQDEHLMKVWPVALNIFRPGQKLQNLLGFRLLVV